jgi:hypothetical protein
VVLSKRRFAEGVCAGYSTRIVGTGFARFQMDDLTPISKRKAKREAKVAARAKAQEIPCVLCERRKKLCYSHVLPEFCYRGVYDDEGQALSFNPLSLDRVQPVQVGVRSHLLCADCEQLSNKNYENPFLAYSMSSEPGPFTTNGDPRHKQLRDVPYRAVKLFHILNLFRAAHSPHSMFKGVALDPDEVRVIRQMLQMNDPGSDLRFPVFCVPVRREPGFEPACAVTPPGRLNWGNTTSILFRFQLSQWVIVLKGSPPSTAIPHRLTTGGTLTVLPIRDKHVQSVVQQWREIAAHRNALLRLSGTATSMSH